MPAPNIPRLAWFLQLQHILRFQKYYFAPQRSRSRRRKPPRDTSTPAQSESLHVAERPFVSFPIKRISMPDYRGPGMRNEPNKSHDALSARVTLPIKIREMLNRLQPREFSWAVRHSIKGSPVGKDHAFTDEPHKSEHLSASAHYRPANAAAHVRTSPPGRPSSRTSLPFPRPADARPSLFLKQSSPGKVRAEGSVRAPPPPARQETDAGRLYENDGNPHPEGLESTSDHEPQQRKTSSAATVHIDGSALGQWAIRHLERSLGKPTTGMTGVDPRASLPRSRVSPF